MWELHHGSPFLPNARNQKLSNSAITQLDEIYLLIEKNPEQKKQETKSQNNSKKVKNTVTIYSWILSYSSIQKKKGVQKEFLNHQLRDIDVKTSQLIIRRWEVVLLTFYLHLLYFCNSFIFYLLFSKKEIKLLESNTIEVSSSQHKGRRAWRSRPEPYTMQTNCALWRVASTWENIRDHTIPYWHNTLWSRISMAPLTER